MWRIAALRVVLRLGLGLLAGPVWAQSPAATGIALSLNEALSRTLAANPDLTAFGFQLQAAEGRLEQSQLTPNPELGVAVQDVLGTDAYSGFGSAETTVTLAWVLERGARRHIVDAAAADLSLRTIDADITRLDVAAETGRRFLTCMAYQERLSIAADSVRMAAQTVELVAERVAAGRSLAAELMRAEADLVRAELLQEDYEHELLSAYHRLSAQWADTQPDYSSVSGDLHRLPVLEPFEALRARVDANPDLERFLSQRRVGEAELQLAEARRRPYWVVSGGFRRVESTDDFALVAGINVPLAIRNRNQGRISEMRAEVARGSAEFEASRIRIQTSLFVLHQALNHDIQFVQRLTADVIPRLESALENTRAAYEVGRSDYSEWRIVQGELLQSRNELLEAQIDAHRLVIEIERLTGVEATATPVQQ